MSKILGDKLVVAISSRALFDLSESHEIYEKEGVEAYSNYQIDKEEDILEAGPAFSLVKKLLALNHKSPDSPSVEVVLLSRNSADTGLRIFNSIQHYQLDISRAAFTSGRSPHSYVSAFSSDLFLSTDVDDVTAALNDGFAAAIILPKSGDYTSNDQEVRFAFDGDAVLFSDESERIYQSQGLEAFTKNEVDSANKPLAGGPFKSFLAALHRLQADYAGELCPIRTALVTARSAPAHERVIKTLRDWNIRIDEALFLGGMKKAEFLKSFEADVFFDDQTVHCHAAVEHVATGHVPHGVTNPTISCLK